MFNIYSIVIECFVINQRGFKNSKFQEFAQQTGQSLKILLKCQQEDLFLSLAEKSQAEVSTFPIVAQKYPVSRCLARENISFGTEKHTG